MFLLGKSFKETLCRRNVKTSVIRSWRKCWKTGGRFLFCLSKKPHVILCLGCHRAYPSWVLDSLSWPCLSPGVSRNTPVTPSFHLLRASHCESLSSALDLSRTGPPGEGTWNPGLPTSTATSHPHLLRLLLASQALPEPS